MPPALADADWSAPWFEPFASAARRIQWRDPRAALAGLNAQAEAAGLSTAGGLPVRFVDAASVRAPSYEGHIAATGRVATRLEGDGFTHDALGALVWLRFPRTKAMLNALQAERIAEDGIGPRRGALRDAATLFDENALVLIAARDADRARVAHVVTDALRRRDWSAALLRQRSAWHSAVVPVAFGHALMQKLLSPFKAITAHAWVWPAPAGWPGGIATAALSGLDDALAAGLADRLSDRSCRLPLPVLGIPGWWPANVEVAFYDDARVFRRAAPSACSERDEERTGRCVNGPADLPVRP